jgi:raffinose/stachyose/melibiose transport system permease protein
VTSHQPLRGWLHGRATPYLYLLPALAIYAVFVLLPVGEAFRLSLFRWDRMEAAFRFVGAANFGKLIRDRVFWRALLNNGALLGLSLAIQLPLALGLAVLLSYPIRARAFFRTVFFAPMVMPSVAIALLWSYVYLPQRGLLDTLIGVFESGFWHDWLSHPSTAMLCVFLTICWRYTGFHMVLYMAGIATIPEELYEAARLDGASEWQAFRHVTLPMLRPVIAVSAALSIIGSLKYFDLVYMMAAGAPEDYRELMATYIYRLAFEDNQQLYGYGSAVAVVLFVIAFAAGALVMRRRKRAEN